MSDERTGDRLDSLSELLAERDHLLGIASWMFDSPDLAEDIVLETHRRWYALQEKQRRRITSPRAWLTRVAAEVCLELVADAKADKPRQRSPLKAVRVLDRADLVTRVHGSLPPDHARATRQFATACRGHDDTALHDVLCPDVIAVTDGGGKVRTPTRPIRGPADVARFVVALLGGEPHARLTVEQVNGAAGIVVRRAGQAQAVVSLSVSGAKVAAVWIVVNPDKLRQWSQVSRDRSD